MKLLLKSDFLNENTKVMSEYYERLNNLCELDLSELDGSKTVLVVMDMVKGFTDFGNLYSDRIAEIKNAVADNMIKCRGMVKEVICFCDCHTTQSAELAAFPPHCISGSGEERIADELKNLCSYKVIEKNSTNGFIEPKFQQWLRENPDVRNYIICGDCTDICVMQFAQCAKAWYNSRNIQSRIIVLTDSTETYDAPVHAANFMNASALMHMECSGIELYSRLK